MDEIQKQKAFKTQLIGDLNEYRQDPELCMKNAILAADYTEKNSSTAEKLDKFKYKEWITWEDSV